MIAQLVLGVGLVSFVALGQVDNPGDSPAGDPLQEGIRLLEDDRLGMPAHGLQEEVKRHLDAKEAFARAVAAKPDDPTAHAWYALALLKTLEKDDALGSAEEAVRLGPQAAFAYCVRGLVHAERDEDDNALADLNQAVRLDPRDAANLRARGEYFADRHQSEKAFADYAAALKVDQRDAKTYWLRAILHMEAANVDLAMKDFDAAILARPDLPALRGARGFIRMFKKDYTGVVDDLGAALSERPDPEMFVMRGVALSQLNRHEEAIHDEPVRLEPDKVQPRLFRGVGRLIAGREGAGDDFRAVLRQKGWRHEVSAICVLDTYIADLLAGRPAEARAFLEEALARCDKGAWPYPLLRCLQGGLSESDALAAAPGEAEKTEARLCLGIKRMTEGHRDAGLRDLREVRDQGDSASDAIDIARAVLRRAGENPPAVAK